jgi:rhodanese-related sulfurtransferase
MMEPDRVSKEELKRRLDAGEHVVFLDTRSDDAWTKADVQIPGSTRVPPDAVEQHLHKIPREGVIVTYCT